MALIEKRILKGGGILGLWQINEAESDLLHRVGQYVTIDAALWERKAENARKQWLCTRLLVWELLGRATDLIYDEYGKPHLADGALELSVSHSGDWVAVLLQQDHPTGIDIEAISPKVNRIRNKFLSQKELLDIHEDRNRDAKLLVYWGAKEALYKLVGKRQVDFRQHLFVEPFTLASHGQISGKIIGKKAAGQYHLNYEKIGGYILVYVLNR